MSSAKLSNNKILIYKNNEAALTIIFANYSKVNLDTKWIELNVDDLKEEQSHWKSITNNFSDVFCPDCQKDELKSLNQPTLVVTSGSNIDTKRKLSTQDKKFIKQREKQHKKLELEKSQQILQRNLELNILIEKNKNILETLKQFNITYSMEKYYVNLIKCNCNQKVPVFSWNSISSENSAPPKFKPHTIKKINEQWLNTCVYCEITIDTLDVLLSLSNDLERRKLL